MVFLVLVGEFSGLVNLTGALTLKTGAAIKFLTLSAYLRDFFLPCAIEKGHTNQTKRYIVLDESVWLVAQLASNTSFFLYTSYRGSVEQTAAATSATSTPIQKRNEISGRWVW